MISHFTFKPIPTIHFGVGKVITLPELASSYGKTFLIVLGQSSFINTAYWQRLQEDFHTNGSQVVTATISDEPSPEDVDTITNNCKNKNIDAVIGIGGGSVLDGGKAIAAMLKEGGSVEQFLEGVGTKEPSGKTVPFIAVPTTSGTGSEATANSVISKTGRGGYKKSLRHANFIPNIALIDPELTLSCSRELTASCGMDCFSQLVEGYLSTSASIFSDSLALEAIKLFHGAIENSYNNLENIEARTAMSYGALVSGIVLANAGLGIIHGFAPPLGSLHNIPHGIVCGTLMAAGNKVTLKKLQQSDSNKEALDKYRILGKLVSSSSKQSNEYYQEAFIDFLEDLTHKFAIPTLASFGVTKNDIPAILNQSANKNNPITLNEKEMTEVLKSRL